jgi:hypothetical protein
MKYCSSQADKVTAKRITINNLAYLMIRVKGRIMPEKPLDFEGFFLRRSNPNAR